MIDAVLSVHTDPVTCGVARFNAILAERLGVPLASLDHHPFACPLISIKTSEAPANWKEIVQWYRRFALFVHDIAEDYWERQREPYLSAMPLYAANQQIATWLRGVRPDVIEVFCPSTLQGRPARGEFRVLTFGMIHKIAAQQFSQLKARLDSEHDDYTVAFSAAMHEGTDYEQAFRRSVETLRGIFGERLRVLGFLADDALARELRECDAVALFFDPAFRANNTSGWAVLEAGKPLYTNTDAQSPPLDVTLHTWDKLLDLIGVGVSV